MNKDESQKNALDLAYQRQLTYLNAILILATIGVLSFIATFIWNKNLLLVGTILTTTILLISYKVHKRINKNIQEISNQIKKL